MPHILFIIVLMILAVVGVFAPYGVVIAATGAIVATTIWLYFLLRGTKPSALNRTGRYVSSFLSTSARPAAYLGSFGALVSDTEARTCRRPFNPAHP